MKRGWTLVVAFLATAAIATASAGSASATVLTSPAGTAYTGALKATATNVSFQGSFTTITCKDSSLEGKVEGHGAAVTATIQLTAFSFSGCNYPVTVAKPGTLTIHASGTTTSTGTELTLHTSVGECIYGTNGTHWGTLTNGTPASLDVAPFMFPRLGGSFFCGSNMSWGGTYTLTAPETLLVD